VVQRDEEVADDQAEPANLDGDGLGRQLPAGGYRHRERLGNRGHVCAGRVPRGVFLYCRSLSTGKASARRTLSVAFHSGGRPHTSSIRRGAGSVAQVVGPPESGRVKKWQITSAVTSGWVSAGRCPHP